MIIIEIVAELPKKVLIPTPEDKKLAEKIAEEEKALEMLLMEKEKEDKVKGERLQIEKDKQDKETVGHTTTFCRF